jgi:ABC-2 type transport system ATP-binding protein
MTVEQIIRFTRPFFPGWRADLERRYLDLFALPPHRKVSALSKGMRTGLMLLLAMSHAPELLILDEPTDGLDPLVGDLLLRELVSLQAEGTTVFFSSHQLSEVEQVADHVAIVDRGRTVVSGALDDLKLQYQRLRIVFQREPVRVSWVDGVERVRQDGRTVSILASRNVDALVEQARSLPVTSVERFPVTLKELFLEHLETN